MRKFIINENLLEELLNTHYKYVCLYYGDVEEWEKYKEALSRKANDSDLSYWEYLKLSTEEKLKEFGCVEDNSINSYEY